MYHRCCHVLPRMTQGFTPDDSRATRATTIQKQEEKLKMLTTSGDAMKLRFPGESGSGQHQAQCVGDTY